MASMNIFRRKRLRVVGRVFRRMRRSPAVKEVPSPPTTLGLK